MERRAKLQRRIAIKKEGEELVKAKLKAEREQREAKAKAEAQPKLTKKEKEKAKKQRQKIKKAKEGGYYVDKIEQKRMLANMLVNKNNYKVEKENALIELQIEYNKRNKIVIPIGKGEIDRAKKMKSSIDYKFIGDFFQKNLDDPMVMDEAYEEYGRRMKEIPRRWKEETDGIQRQILLNQEKRKNKIKGKFGTIPQKTDRSLKPSPEDIPRLRTTEQDFISNEASRRAEIIRRKMIDEPIRKEYVRETKSLQEISPEDYYESFIEGVKTDPLDAKRRSINTFVSQNVKRKQFKYEARETFNQPNADKFGLKDDGTPRSRKEFAHRFRGKTETEVSDMIDQEVRDRTPEQRGAFLQRAVGTLKSQNITDEGVLQAGGNRVGAGEFIASQLAKKDIEQITPDISKKGFISKEFTPDNMRKIGAISQEEEGLLGIKKRREQQYQKEWSADGTTMKSTGLATLDQEKYTKFEEREDALLNAVAGNLEPLFFKKSGEEKAIDVKKVNQEFEEKTTGSIDDLQNRKFGGIKPITKEGVMNNLNRIQTEFRNTDKYLQTQRNYAIQKEFIDIIQKSQQAEDIFSQYQKNNKDFTSTGYVDSPYVDTDLNFNGKGGYGARFYQLISEGQQPLQFLLNTKTNEILKFAGDNMMSGDGNDNGIGDIAVVNEVNMGGRIAFIGHTFPQYSNPTPEKVGQQGGNLRGASYGYMSVFSNPYEENSPLVKQNRFLPTTQLNQKSFFSYTQRQFGNPNIKGFNFSISVAGGKGNKTGPKRQDVSTKFGTSEDIYIRQLTQKGGAQSVLKLAPDYEQIRKGTYLPKEFQPLDQTTLRKQLRTRQLNAQFNLSTTALKQKTRIGLQGMK